MSESLTENDEHRTGDALRDGRFAIVQKLGEGGQGTTYEAIDKREGRKITLKRFRVRGASSWKEVELAEREAKVLADVRHPHLPVYVDHFEENGSLYLATEHIEGETIARLRKDGPIAERDVLRFLADAAGALDYLHKRSPPLVHRDIKPTNVLRRRDGSFAIIDFGAVRDRLKATGSTVVGTFGYMAPEQFQGRAMPASDVYAVGTTAIAMLSGREPEDLPHKGLSIDVAASLPNASPDLVRALASMVEADPDKRATSITPLLKTLRRSDAAEPRKRASDRQPPPGDGPRRAAPDPKTQREGRDEFDEAGEEVRRVAEEIGETFLRVVDEVSKGSAKDLKREAKRAFEHVKREAKKHQAEERERRRERTAEQRERKRERAAEERERRRQREEMRERDKHGTAPLGGPILLVVLLALTVAQLAVILALRVVTPVVLYIVSALFFGSVPGRALRSAAGAVSQAGKHAVGAIGRAKDLVRGRTPPSEPRVRVMHDPSVDPHAPTHISTVDAARGARFDEREATRTRARVGDDFEIDDGTAEEDALAEEDMEARKAPPKPFEERP